MLSQWSPSNRGCVGEIEPWAICHLYKMEAGMSEQNTDWFIEALSGQDQIIVVNSQVYTLKAKENNSYTFIIILNMNKG